MPLSVPAFASKESPPMRPRSQLSSNSRRTARNCEYRHLVSLVPQRSHQPDIAAGDRRDERLLCESNSWDISLRMFSGWAYGWPAHEAFASARADSSGVALRGQAGGAHVLGWIEPCNVCVRIGKALQAGLADRRIRNDGERRVTRMMGILIPTGFMVSITIRRCVAVRSLCHRRASRVLDCSDPLSMKS
jgi:hypothetical protein